MCSVKESEKILDPGSAPKVNGVNSGMRLILLSGFVENRLLDLCYSVDKPTNQPKNGHEGNPDILDRGNKAQQNLKAVCFLPD